MSTVQFRRMRTNETPRANMLYSSGACAQMKRHAQTCFSLRIRALLVSIPYRATVYYGILLSCACVEKYNTFTSVAAARAMSSYRSMTDASGDVSEEPFRRFGNATATHLPQLIRSTLTRGFVERIDPEVHNRVQSSVNCKLVHRDRCVSAARSARYLYVNT